MLKNTLVHTHKNSEEHTPQLQQEKIHFNSFNLPPRLQQRLSHIQFQHPTPIQQKTIPIALLGKDILGSAQTGTGKTAAFMIPIIAQLFDNPQGQALILTPTRELAKQILDFTHLLISQERKLKTALLIGGNPIHKQFYQLKKQPQIIIGTPGRINDHLERKSLHLDRVKFLVLDETDCMLDMGFDKQLAKIKPHLPIERQTLMFSATIPQNIIQIANQYLNNPQRIAIDNTQSPAKNIKQAVLYMKSTEKYSTLCQELQKRTGSTLIFVKTKIDVEKLYEKIKKEKIYRIDFIHGGLTQSRRDRIIKKFKQGYITHLIATDVASRGLDIPHIAHVINYDLPQCPEDYIHRIGRTARAGKNGEALCFVTSNEQRQWKSIHYFLVQKNVKIEGEVPVFHTVKQKNTKYARKNYNPKRSIRKYQRSTEKKKSWHNNTH